MNSSVAALIQGIVEGLTEFLPVSSTAHIIIAQELLHIERSNAFWKMFAVVIQLGAILAVVAFFWKRLFDFVRNFPNVRGTSEKPTSPRSWWTHPLSLVLISFVVTAIPCFLIDKWIGDNLENLMVIGLALIIGGIAMYGIDRWSSRRATTHAMESMTLAQAVVIGSAQILAAAFPGTSRSMATIAGGQLMGLSRPAALEFSFFLSIPVMFAAASFKLLQFMIKDPVAMSSERWLALGYGFVTSFVVAIAVIAWLMSWVRKHGFAPFAIYRVVAGGLVLAWNAWLR